MPKLTVKIVLTLTDRRVLQGGPNKWYRAYITLHCTRGISFLAHPVMYYNQAVLIACSSKSFYSKLDRMTTRDFAFSMPHNQNDSIFQPFYCASITLLDIKRNKCSPIPLLRSVCLPLWFNWVTRKWLSYDTK